MSTSVQPKNSRAVHSTFISNVFSLFFFLMSYLRLKFIFLSVLSSHNSLTKSLASLVLVNSRMLWISFAQFHFKILGHKCFDRWSVTSFSSSELHKNDVRKLNFSARSVFIICFALLPTSKVSHRKQNGKLMFYWHQKPIRIRSSYILKIAINYSHSN